MKFWDNYVKLLIIQGIIVLIIVLGVLIVKFGLKSTYSEFKNWYKENVLTDTDVYEVVE